MNESIETMRVLLELALSSANRRKSTQTGFLHYCYHASEQEPHLPIPLVENFLFALALLRSRTMENIKEAKGLLNQLLFFQNRTGEANENGNFPIYIHEFPSCKDYYTGIHVSFIICWILRHFHHILGQELKSRLEESLKATIEHILFIHAEKRISYFIEIKIGAVLVAAGQLLENPGLCSQGFSILDRLNGKEDETAWYCPESLGEIAVSLLLVYPSLNNSPWKSLWDHLQLTWHRNTASYAGPALKERQQGFEPQVTLYDFLCGYFSDQLSDRALNESWVHLKAVLIPPSEERFSLLNYPVVYQKELQGAVWYLHHSEKMAYSGIFLSPSSTVVSKILEGENHDPLANNKGMHPFRLIWGDKHRVHTLVCQGGNVCKMSCQMPSLIFDLGKSIDVEDREKNREVMFFLDAQENMQFLVEEEKSSTFLLGDGISIKDRKIQIHLKFLLLEGEGRFLGHRMLGNRPAQLETKGNHRYEAYDWQVFLRTISRSEHCRIQVLLEIKEEQ